MGDFTHREHVRVVAVVLVAALAMGVLGVVLLGTSEQERFRSWLREQPGVVSVEGPDRALAAGTAALRAVREFEPTDRAEVSLALEAAVVDRLSRAIVRYATTHEGVVGRTVQLHRGQDVVLVTTRATENDLAVAVMRAAQALPSRVSVDLGFHGSAAPFIVTVRAGTDLPEAASVLARALRGHRGSWVSSSPSVAVRDDRVGHEVSLTPEAVVRPPDAAAFALAVDQDPMHRVRLQVVAGQGGDHTASHLHVSDSPRTGATVSALQAAGYGLASRHESVETTQGPAVMDEKSWAEAAAVAIARTPAVREARVDVGSAVERRPVTADLRVEPQVSFGEVLRSLPAPVEQVTVHTAPGAPDYDRDDALAPDPEVDCPAEQGGLNLAYSGPVTALPTAANYLAALRAVESGTSCVHWTERGERGRPAGQTLFVRLALEEKSWRPVLDVVRARRADLGSAHPDVVLLLPLPGSDVTGVFTLSEGDAPFVTSLDAQARAQTNRVEAALAPLVRYWDGR